MTQLTRLAIALAIPLVVDLVCACDTGITHVSSAFAADGISIVPVSLSLGETYHTIPTSSAAATTSASSSMVPTTSVFTSFTPTSAISTSTIIHHTDGSFSQSSSTYKDAPAPPLSFSTMSEVSIMSSMSSGLTTDCVTTSTTTVEVTMTSTYEESLTTFITVTMSNTFVTANPTSAQSMLSMTNSSSASSISISTRTPAGIFFNATSVAPLGTSNISQPIALSTLHTSTTSTATTTTYVPINSNTGVVSMDSPQSGPLTATSHATTPLSIISKDLPSSTFVGVGEATSQNPMPTSNPPPPSSMPTSTTPQSSMPTPSLPGTTTVSTSPNTLPALPTISSYAPILDINGKTYHTRQPRKICKSVSTSPSASSMPPSSPTPLSVPASSVPASSLSASIVSPPPLTSPSPSSSPSPSPMPTSSLQSTPTTLTFASGPAPSATLTKPSQAPASSPPQTLPTASSYAAIVDINGTTYHTRQPRKVCAVS